MGVKLILLLASLAAVLYGLHTLVRDYQSLTASKVLRLLFKRDITIQDRQLQMHRVRWADILRSDPLQCARYLYCELGARPPDDETRRGLVGMLYLDPTEGDKEAYDHFKAAYLYGRASGGRSNTCPPLYKCPFNERILFSFVQFLLQTN